MRLKWCRLAQHNRRAEAMPACVVLTSVLQSRAAVGRVVVGIAADAGVEGLGFEEGPVPEGEEGERSAMSRL